jgi:hypothetical protein
MELEVTKEQLEKFIQDKDLEELEVELNNFSFFDVFQYQEKETLHSKIIAWLLNPKESHGLKDYFLKKFLIKVLSLPFNKNNIYNKLSSIDIDVLDLDNSFVQTEEVFDNNRRADITLLNDDNSLYVLLENKISSPEIKEQTKHYAKESRIRYPDLNYIFIFLTKNGDKPESDEFILCSYSEIIELLKDLLKSNKINLSIELTIFIKEFLRNIQVNIMNDSKIEELCSKIYQNHSKAIEAIFKIKPTNKVFYEELGKLVIKHFEGEWSYRSTNSYCSIFMNKWKSKHSLNNSMPFIHYEFNDVGSTGKVRIGIHVEYRIDDDVREEFKNLLRNEVLTVPKLYLNNVQVIYSEKTFQISDVNDLPKFKQISDKMIKLIENTFHSLDNAFEKIK